MKQLQFNVYPIDEHPDPEKVYQWIRENWHDLNDHDKDELIEALECLAEIVDGELNYSISTVPDRGEYLTLDGLDWDILNGLEDDQQLTGSGWDESIIRAAKNNYIASLMVTLHKQTEYVYSDVGLQELCESNDYHFDESGKFWPT